MSKDSDFKLAVATGSEYEELVIYLDFKNELVAILNCDKGHSLTEIEILDTKEFITIWKFNHHEFIKALTRAYEKLKEANQNVITE